MKSSDYRISNATDSFCHRHYTRLSWLILALALFNVSYRLNREFIIEWDESLYAVSAWEALKKGVKENDLADCQRSKVGCLRICCHGPTMVVYPEGTWYHGMTAERIPRFVQEHLVEGRPIEEWIFARNPLPAEKS